jgi:hypothetical protein
VVSQLVGAHPYVYAFLIPYFVLMGYVVINFFSGMVIYYLYEVSAEELKTGERAKSEAEVRPQEREIPEPVLTELLIELRSLRQEVALLREKKS